MTTPLSRPRTRRREERADTRDILVHAGLAHVLESGWAATGIDKVLRSVSVPKGSFYYYFASKDAFGLALLDCYQVFYLKRLERCFGAQAEPGLAGQMSAFLDESIQGMERFNWRRGCLIGALGQELGAVHESFREHLNAAIQQWEIILAGAIRAAQERGELKRTLDADRSARSFWTAWEGAVLRARLTCSAVPLTEAVNDFLHLATS